MGDNLAVPFLLKDLFRLHAFRILDSLVFAGHHVGILGPAKVLLLLSGALHRFEINNGCRFDSFHAIHVPCFDLGPHVLTLLHVKLVIPLILDQLFVLNRHNRGGYFGNKVTIVRYHHDGTRKMLQGLLQHFAAGDIKMVGGFVEDQKVGRSQHHATKRQASLFTATQEFHLFLHSVALEQELTEQGTQFIVGLTGTGILESLQNRLVQIQHIGLVLFKVVHYNILSHQFGASFVGSFLGSDKTEQSRLSRSIRSHASNTISLFNKQIHIIKQPVLSCL
mmetsp:Transcript_6454/g.13188  ORF Transcript_6454/g.13188 Transcript_6454/m.13188 type:complete len:279 (-) Transcript_6454:1753-2589(-)